MKITKEGCIQLAMFFAGAGMAFGACHLTYGIPSDGIATISLALFGGTCIIAGFVEAHNEAMKDGGRIAHAFKRR